MRICWKDWTEALARCQKCPLAHSRNCVVPGEGNPDARLMLIGEGPGAEEDRSGRPFVGRAGELLTKMLAAIGLSREEVYICNVVKCRPPGNRTPMPEEAAACLPYLRCQVALVRPQVILLLGATAGRYTLDPDLRITRDRGQWVQRKGVWMMPTFHPAALLRNESLKRPVWTDLKAVKEKLDELGPKPVREGAKIVGKIQAGND